MSLRAPSGETARTAVGFLVDPDTLRSCFGCPSGLLDRMTNARTLLSVPTATGSLAYPAFQFDSGGEPLPGLARVLGALDPARLDPWGAALWLIAEHPGLAGQTPAATLRAGSVDAVVRVAEAEPLAP